MATKPHSLTALSARVEIAARARKAFHENLMLALDTLRTHKFRSFLTVLGVLIGTMTVIAVASIIALSIFLREKGSPESKPVHAPHAETGS